MQRDSKNGVRGKTAVVPTASSSGGKGPGRKSNADRAGELRACRKKYGADSKEYKAMASIKHVCAKIKRGGPTLICSRECMVANNAQLLDFCRSSPGLVALHNVGWPQDSKSRATLSVGG